MPDVWVDVLGKGTRNDAAKIMYFSLPFCLSSYLSSPSNGTLENARVNTTWGLFFSEHEEIFPL